MSEDLTPEKISRMKVRELKTSLRQLGLPQNGNKATLQKRLNEYILNNITTQDNSNNNDVIIETETSNNNNNENDNNTVNTGSVIDTSEQEREYKADEEIINETPNGININNNMEPELREDMDMNNNNNNININNDNDNDNNDDNDTVVSNQITLSQISKIEMEFRRKQRLQRFGAVTEKDKREQRKRRFNDIKLGNNDFSLGSIMNTNNDSVSNIANKIQLRQQKFGIITNDNNSSVRPNKRLKLMDPQKIEERKQRFGIIDNEQKLKMRRDRFGGITEKDKIQQRKDRFSKNNSNGHNTSNIDFNTLKNAGPHGLMHVDATLDDIAKFNQQKRNNGRGRLRGRGRGRGSGRGRGRGRGRGNYNYRGYNSRIKRGNIGRGKQRGNINNGINGNNALNGNNNDNSSNNVIFSDF